MSEPIRLLDLGIVSSLRSQTIFHAIAHTMTPGSPDTITFMSPADPYICVGFHQDVEEEVDLAWCQQAGLPVYRREVGGGAVYLDRNQVFYHWIFHADRLPPGIEDMFRLYGGTLVDAYRATGIAADFRPINDIHVSDRKIGGTGAARIGDAIVLAGSLMFDFDAEAFSRAAKVPDEKFRDKLRRGLRDYMTTIRRELGQPPTRDEMVQQVVDVCRRTLGREIRPGSLTGREREEARRLDAVFRSAEWVFQAGGMRRPRLRIREGVEVARSTYKAPGGLIRVTALLREGVIDDASLSGDFTLQPARTLPALEDAIRELPPDRDEVAERVAETYEKEQAQSPGITPDHWGEAVEGLATPANG